MVEALHQNSAMFCFVLFFSISSRHVTLEFIKCSVKSNHHYPHIDSSSNTTMCLIHPADVSTCRPAALTFAHSDRLPPWPLS